MKHRLIVQNVSEADDIPENNLFEQWMTAALSGADTPRELTIRVVNEYEGRELNARYRGRHHATNVLSFPADLPAAIAAEIAGGQDFTPIGDLVLCAPVIKREASEQGKTESHHWAHMIVHGVLHLIGMDHEDESEAGLMERREIEILSTLGIPDPYQ